MVSGSTPQLCNKRPYRVLIILSTLVVIAVGLMFLFASEVVLLPLSSTKQSENFASVVGKQRRVETPENAKEEKEEENNEQNEFLYSLNPLGNDKYKHLHKQSKFNRLPNIVTPQTLVEHNLISQSQQQQQQQQQQQVATNKTNNTNKIQRIVLLGERNSGTTWITAHLRSCFNHTIPTSVELARHKHWFQHDVNPSARVRDTLVVSIFRNPCTWVDAMQRKSYRAPLHYKLKDWYEFVTRPWTVMEREEVDQRWVETFLYKWKGKGEYDDYVDVDDVLYLPKQQQGTKNSTIKQKRQRQRKLKTKTKSKTPNPQFPPPTFSNLSSIPCQQDFTYHQINACVERPYLPTPLFEKRASRRRQKGKHPQFHNWKDARSGQEPFYELHLDGSGRAYDSIVEMRRDKIWNFVVDVVQWDWIRAVLPVQYEELVRLGTESLIKSVEEVTGVKARCEASPPQKRGKKELDGEFRRWMEENVDWEMEGLIGFEGCE